MQRILIVFIFSLGFSFSEAQTFEKVHIEDANISPWSVAETANGNFIAVGNYQQANNWKESDPTFGYVVKFDSLGEILSEKLMPIPGSGFTQIIKMPDTTYLVVGRKSVEGNLWGWLIKIDEDLTIIWEKGYPAFNGYESQEFLYASIEDITSDIIITGVSSNSSGASRISLLKTDKYGNILIKKTFTVNIFNYPTGLIQTSDGEFFLSAFNPESEILILLNDNLDTIAVKQLPFSSHGNEQESTYHYYAIYGLKAYVNTVYANLRKGMTSGIGSELKSETNICFMRIDSNLDTIQTTVLGVKNIYEIASGLDFIDPNQIYLSGVYDFYSGTLYPENHPGKYYLVKVDSSGNKYWERYFGDDSSYNFSTNIVATTDGGCLIVGMRYHSNSSTLRDIYLVKVDKDGNVISSGVKDEQRIKTVVYPNPSQGVFRAEWYTPLMEPVKFTIMDVQGRLIYSQQVTSRNFVEFDLTEKPSGSYFFSIITESGKKAFGKLIKN